MLPAEEDLVDYDPYDGPCCTAENFRPDLDSTPSSAWNRSIIEVFVEHFMDRKPSAPQDRVEELFEGHLKYLCQRWQEGTKLDEATLRRRAKLMRRAERQRNLYYRRLMVAEAYGPLRRHIPMLKALGVHGMSSDESDHRNGSVQYGVFKKEWRHPAVTPWVRVFDSLYRRLRFNAVQLNTPGSHPHKRSYSDIVSTRHSPVKCLPTNAYDPQWLRKLNVYDRKQLRVKEDVQYEFTHDAEMLRCALVR
ncbi:hypothetical protein OH77DRAFT_1410198 [Trametes cingulata]|nr:hypothetical protein OH77DRAFT_1410198 [Trametes cingulata]